MSRDPRAELTFTAEGGWVATGFGRRVLLMQALVGLLAFATLTLLVPWALMLETGMFADLAWAGLKVAAGAIALTAATSAVRLKRNRKVLRTLALGSDAVTPDDIGGLAYIPFALSLRFIVSGLLAATAIAVPGIRPERLDDARALSLSLIMFTIIAASAVVHYVVVRESILRLIELSPLEPTTVWLEREAVRLAPAQRVTRKVLLAVVAPVALVGVGTVLVTHAHLRAKVEQGRALTARSIARAALEPVGQARGDVGRDDVIAAAVAHGFFVRIDPTEDSDAGRSELPVRLASGQLEIPVQLDQGRAQIRYSAELAPEVIISGALLGLLAVLLAAIVGRSFGRSLASDLLLATRQVAELGTEKVLRGKARVAGPARFRVVAEMGRSVEALAERFREFAAAQERALNAKESAHRMKQLLFASVSHDLKSPLNAVLGFAELVRSEDLSQAQLESIDMVSSRGRELLALIETILDAARVDAGQMQLLRQPSDAESLIRGAVDKAFDLHAGSPSEVLVEVAPAMPVLDVDPNHAARAVAVLIAHAMSSAGPQAGRVIQVRGSVPASRLSEGSGMARIHIEYAAADSRPSLLEAQLAGKVPSSTGRGMVLRLSLARSIIELHGGRVEVGRGTHGAATVTCWLPTA